MDLAEIARRTVKELERQQREREEEERRRQQAERDREAELQRQLDEQWRLINASRPPPVVIPEALLPPPPPANPPIYVPPPPKKPENHDLIIGYPKPPTPPVTGYPIPEKSKPKPIPPADYDEVLVPVDDIREQFDYGVRQPNFLERIISWLQSLFRN